MSMLETVVFGSLPALWTRTGSSPRWCAGGASGGTKGARKIRLKIQAETLSAAHKLAVRLRSLRRRSVSFRRVPEACGGGPQASAASQKLAAALRKLPPRSRSLWRRSASFRRDPEACGGAPQASAAFQKLVVADRKVLADD